MTNIIGKVQSLGFDRSNAEEVNQCILNLAELGVQGVSRFKKKLQKAPDKAIFQDYWLEGVYARIFAASGFSVSFEPCGRKGPDIQVKIDNHDIYIEVKHLRMVNNWNKSQRRAVAGMIKDKLEQTLENEINMVILHSDRFEISESTFHKGLYLCKRNCHNCQKSRKKFLRLSGVVVNLPQFSPVIKGPIYWRFLRTSRKKVPPKVKARIRTTLSGQNIKAYQRVVGMTK